MKDKNLDEKRLRKEKKEKREKKELEFNSGDLKDNLKHAKKTKVIVSILKFAILIFILIVIPIYLLVCKGDTLKSFKSLSDVMDFLNQYKAQSILVYIGLQVMQIVICIIPGQAFQFAAGYLYGFIFGLIFSIIGAAIGTVISFYLAKFLGSDALRLMFSEERFGYFVERLNSKRAYMIVFLIYLIPGLPKDTMSYAAGVSDMRFKPFLIISLIGRTPAMAGSLLIGALYYKGHYTAMWVVVAVAVIAFILCVIKREAIKRYIDKFYNKIVE